MSPFSDFPFASSLLYQCHVCQYIACPMQQGDNRHYLVSVMSARHREIVDLTLYVI